MTTAQVSPRRWDEMGLADYARELRRHWWVIVTATIAAALAGLVVSWGSTTTYEAAATLVVRSPSGETPTPQLMTEARKQLENHETVNAALRAVGLDKHSPPVDVDTFVRVHLETRPVPGSYDLLNVLVRLGEPDLAARAANQLAREAIARNTAEAQRTTTLPSFMQAQIQDARERVLRSETDLLRYRREHRTARGDLPLEVESRLARLETEYEVARKVYETVSSRGEESKIQMAMRNPELRLADGAVRPSRPSSPRTAYNVAAGAALGLLLSILGVVARIVLSRIEL